MPYGDPEKQREYQRLWIAKRRAEYFADKVCMDCGTTEKLEIDHVDSSQKITHRVWSWSEARRKAELAKCVVRCDPCHIIKTIAVDLPQPRHGTRTMYERHKCKCDDCKAAKRVHNASRYTPA